jgi:hypothetical protein
MRHPHCKTWRFPPERPELATRTNLRELVARPDRFEHHLVVVAQIGNVQLEVTAASEPLFFAHENLSDEFALPLPTGDPMIDHFPFRTFIMDRATAVDAGRYNHGVGELVLHPDGWLHWPGRLRPPYQPMEMLPELRRCGMSLVYCANVRTPSTPVTLPDHGDIKPYASPAPPMSLVPVMSGPDRTIAAIGPTTLAVVVSPSSIAPARGGWAVVLEGDAPGDLHRIAEGEALDGTGITRALVFASTELAPDPIPPSWFAPPEPAFAPFEAGAQATFVHPAITATVLSDSTVAIAIGESRVEVPRYWLARMLFRVALHPMRLNYVETYGGVFVDDRDGLRIGIRTGASSSVNLAEIENLYRAIAPAGYTERLPIS